MIELNNFMIKSLTVSFSLFYAIVLAAEPLHLHVKSDCAILMNADSGAILFEKNAHQRVFPASTTKIATAFYALKKIEGDLDQKVVISPEALRSTTEEAKKKANFTLPPHWLESDGSQAGLRKGEEISFRELLQGMLIASGNDASNAIAFHIGKSMPQFMKDLNACLQEIGCLNTSFNNPHGLYHPEHFTTAYDLAILTKEALKIPLFCQIVSSLQCMIPRTPKHEARVLVQTNKLLKKGPYYYSKAIGVKTGYTKAGGPTLVAAARDQDRILIAVLLKSTERNDRFADALKLFEAAFQQRKVERTLLLAGPQKYILKIEGATGPVKTFLKNDVKMSYYPAEEPVFRCLLFWDDVKPPIKKDQPVGALRIQTQEGKEVFSTLLFASEDVSATKLYSLKKISAHLWRHDFIVLGFVGILLVSFCVYQFLLRRR